MWQIILVFVVVYLLYRLKKGLKFRRLINAYPGKPCNFLLGNSLDLPLQSDKFFKRIRDFGKEYPDGYRLWFGPFGIFNFIIADDVEVLLSSTKNIEKSVLYDFLHTWFGTGLLTSGDTKWQPRRKLLTPAFHFGMLKRFVRSFGEHGKKIVQELATECNESKTNITPILSKCTLNIICDTAMGISLDAEDETQMKYIEAIHCVGVILVERMLTILYYPDFIFNLSPLGRRYNKNIKLLHEFTTNVIKERERTFKDEILETSECNTTYEDDAVYSKKRFAMLDLLIAAKKNGEIDDAGIQEEIDTFMFEGHDTVSAGICYTLLMLANHKDVQERVRAEMDDIFQQTDRLADYEDLKNMPYLDMCIKETLRLCPSVPFIARRITKETTFRGGKYTMPVGAVVHVHIYDLHRDPRVFPDPEKFDPDRFLPENVIGLHPYAYIPFSAGSRNCIGQRFAMMEMKCVVSSILRYYELDAVESYSDITLKADLILRSKDGIHIKFKARRSTGIL